ncbi:MAG: glycosyltransferase family 87 protein [Actinomycetes bacterium]
MKRPRLRAYLGLGLLAAGLCGLALSGDLIVHIERFVAFYGLSLAGFALLATAATSLPLRGALVAAVVLRVIFLPGTPSLTDDFYRYQWDGRVQQAGVNPYRYAPSDPRLDRVGYADRDRVNHPRLRTVYPPLAEATFYGVAAAGGGVLAFKLLFGAFDLLTAAAVWWLADAKRRRQATVLYLLCPAVILQTWGQAHLEIVAVSLVVLAAAALLRGRDWQAGVLLGLAAAFKVTPAALLVPALLGGRAQPARFLAGFIPALVVPYVPYLLSGGAFGSLFESGTGWSGGALLFALLARIVEPEVARLLCLAFFLFGAVWIARSLRGRARTAPAFAWTLTLLIFCLPVVHAWYWLAPLALGLAAGLWLPVVIGLAAPFPEALAGRWPVQAPPWRRLGAVAVWRRPARRAGVEVAATGAVPHTEHMMERRERR